MQNTNQIQFLLIAQKQWLAISYYFISKVRNQIDTFRMQKSFPTSKNNFKQSQNVGLKILQSALQSSISGTYQGNQK